MSGSLSGERRTLTSFVISDTTSSRWRCNYVSLALEAAINARWSASLPKTVTPSCGDKKREMPFASHTRIFEFCMKERWERGKVFVNGERFPVYSEVLLDWLERRKIITKWERRRLRTNW
jgi:hypothetical protein